ncbi:MAG: ABC transporter permease subunit [Anaerolineae bacterium]
MGLQTSTSRLTPKQADILWRWGLSLAFFVILIGAWEWFGRVYGGLLFAPFTKTMVAFIKLLASSEIYGALWASNQAMLLGFAASVVIGIPLGLLVGRLQRLERFVDVYLNILIVTPMAAVIPLIIVFIGLGLTARVLVVFLFAFPIMTVNTRAGLKNLDRSLIEMARSFGASEMQLWRKILLPGSTPAMMAGVRLGLGRALTGMVVVELLLVAVGLGKLILNAMGYFEPDRAYAVIIVIVIEAVVVMGIAKRVEDKLIAWKPRL